MNSKQVIDSLNEISRDFASTTAERQRRRELDPDDFARLKSAGFLLTGVPADRGGLWRGVGQCIRDYATMVRVIARGDPSVALVAAMHPAVMAFFLGVEIVDDEPDAWLEQRLLCTELARENWWGTITSEPGSGGDISKTNTHAQPGEDGHYQLTGEKHFGSGSGHARYMITTGRCEGSESPDLFWMDMAGVPWDGSTGCQMTIPWDGIGMTATQSHAFRFSSFPATKSVTNELLTRVSATTTISSNLLFTGVILGIADSALAFAGGKLKGKSLRAFEQTEWTRCQNEIWLAQQAFEGALRAAETEHADAALAALRCKVTSAELVDSALGRMGKAVGGASFSRAMPLAQWTQDVKALIFLRPPMPLAYDQLHAMASA
jgi:alkylation response protein AidB-like acyl-CoA dehydrogenase